MKNVVKASLPQSLISLGMNYACIIKMIISLKKQNQKAMFSEPWLVIVFELPCGSVSTLLLI